MRVATTLVVLLSLFIGSFVSAAAQDEDLAFIAGAQRQFAASEMPASGIGFLQFTVHVMPSARDAEEQFPDVVARMREYFTTMVDTPVNIRPVSIMDIGDESQAFAMDTTVQGIPVSMLVIGWRDGTLIYTAASAALSGDQLSELKPIVLGLEGREYNDVPVRRDSATDMHIGGAWDLLPGLQDIPEGFALQREIPLVPALVGTPAVSQ